MEYFHDHISWFDSLKIQTQTQSVQSLIRVWLFLNTKCICKLEGCVPRTVHDLNDCLINIRGEISKCCSLVKSIVRTFLNKHKGEKGEEGQREEKRRSLLKNTKKRQGQISRWRQLIKLLFLDQYNTEQRGKTGRDMIQYVLPLLHTGLPHFKRCFAIDLT